jgi:hypothetical protein
MSTAEAIYQYIAALAEGMLFATQELLQMGSRDAIDACLYRMVKVGKIIRWTSGVFIRAEEHNRVPSALEVATFKARVFGKKIAQHGLDAAHALGLVDAGNPTPTFLACCRHSSFLLAKKTRIHTHGTVPRKLLLLDQFGESVVKALWHLGEKNATEDLIEKFLDKLTPTQRKQVQAMRRKMPGWMSTRMMALWEARAA